MSEFDEIDMDAQAVIEDVFADPITILPRVGDPNYGGATDPLRPPKVIPGILAAAPSARGQMVTGRAQPTTNGAFVEEEIWISADAYRGLGYDIARQDLVEFSAKRRTIIDVQKGDQGDVVLIIGR